MKDNSFYFQHDNTASSDEKILDLRSVLGFEGYGIYWALIELLHQNNGKMQMQSKRIAFALQVDEQMLSKVINDFNLFVIENGNFYSNRLLNQIKYRSEIIEKRRNAGSKGGKSKANAKQMLSKKLPKERKEKDSKGEDNKGDKSIEEKEKEFRKQVFSFQNKYSDQMLLAFFNYWSEKSKSGKLRWELEKTYEVSKRLVTWFNREKKNSSEPYMSPMDYLPVN